MVDRGEFVLHHHLRENIEDLATATTRTLAQLDRERSRIADPVTRAAMRNLCNQARQQSEEPLTARIETMYLDKLDGRITATFFDEKAASWRQEQDKLQARITELRHQTKNYDDAITTVEKIGNLCKEFPNQPAGEQRRLLGIIIDNAT